MDVRTLRRTAAGLLVAATMVGCSEQTTSPVRLASPNNARRDVIDDDPDGGLYACTLSGPPGTYSFHIDIVGGGDMLLGPHDLSVTFDGTNEACALFGKSVNAASWGPGVTAKVTMTETMVPAGVKVDSMQTYDSNTGYLSPGVTNTATLSANSPMFDRLWFAYYHSAAPTNPGSVEACQTSGPAGTYTFRVDVTGGGPYTLPNGNVKSVSYNGSTPACATMYVPKTPASWPSGTTASVKISQLLTPFGVDEYSYAVTKNGGAGATVRNLWSVTVPVAFSDVVSAKFTDKTWQLGNQGCSASFWQTAAATHWADAGYAPSQPINTILVVPSSLTLNGAPLGSYTLLQGLGFAGGSTTSGKAQLLIRSTIAALLNVADPNVAYASPGSVTTVAADAALASNSSLVMSALTAVSDYLNNSARGGCPLH